MSAALHAVPNDPQTPWPVDLTRVIHAMSTLSLPADVLIPERAAGSLVDRVPFLLSVDPGKRFLSIRAVWETAMDPAETAHWMLAAADSWNREKYFPTIYWTLSDSDTVHVCADFVVDALAGLSEEQLKENLRVGLSTGVSAITYMQEAAHQTLELPVLRAHRSVTSTDFDQ